MCVRLPGGCGGGRRRVARVGMVDVEEMAFGVEAAHDHLCIRFRKQQKSRIVGWGGIYGL